MNWFQWFILIWFISFIVIIFIIGNVFMIVVIVTTIVHANIRDKSNDPRYPIDIRTYPEKWLGDKVNINGKTLEITDYSNWHGCFYLSNGAKIGYDNPKLKVRYHE